ncbi:hypothetical protein HYPSUDRAFT_36232 [Hypholoma sublateritium FD-334 SS-4]|uniref:Uncharacterized protein n=1 Tax=Hypholoma sublateritium (strain FD-334 SS-4) TaxID=945553 RepID=A0A0D2Q4J8_HYPSF|nr:hypothetical protein HYPSUDRAFT_36232 [Hypholoma sublateritium FD-334 SS-4]
MSDPTYPLFPIIAFLGFFLCLIPLPWHLYSGNSGTCYYIMWASIACLNQFVNSVVWAGSVANSSPGWCEISIRIMLGASVGLPASSLCINRRLYHIASVQTVTISSVEKRRAVIVDSLICVVFPLAFIALQYVVQGHRFNIFEDIGCYPAIYNTLPAYFLSSMWPIVIGLISSVYCVLSLRAFAARRLQFSQLLSANASLTVSRYFRLMALAMTDVLFTVPLAVFTIWLDATATPIGPWISWADTHFNYSRVEQIPSILWRQNRLLSVCIEFTRWTTPFCAIVFFAYFGFAEEAKKNYRRTFTALRKVVGCAPVEQSTLPSWSIGAFRKPKESSVADTIASNPTFVRLDDIKRVPSLVSSSRTLDGTSTCDISSQIGTPQDDRPFFVPSLPEKRIIDDV